ncbi:hypothetical protein [Polycyclovorans algicola]|uniref:hypothetical protein n=1 Tax=Polycyclovorans algicola TaxID=616992 RepID=UPI0012692B53|nr:hypothetical protein [Polycyclovorans algicola]
MQRIVIAACSVFSLFIGTASASESYAIDLSRSAGSERDAAVAILSSEEYDQLMRGVTRASEARQKLRQQRRRSLEVTADPGGEQGAVEAALTELRHGQRVVICALGPEEGSQSLYLSLWNRSTDGSGPQFSNFKKIYPAGSPAVRVNSDEVLCIGQPGSGFSVNAQYDAKGATEQIYAHYSTSEATQFDEGDVLVLGKGATRSTRAPTGDYWSAFAVFSVSKN